MTGLKQSQLAERAGKGSQVLFPAFFNVFHLSLSLSLSPGKFAIRPEKKAEPVTKEVKYVGMIAGGTGTYI